MSAALKSPPRDPELLYLYPPRGVGGPQPRTFGELDLVQLRVPVRTFDGVTVPAAAIGTVVTVWDDGAAYDVEFVEPAGLASVEARDLDPA